MMGSRRFSFSFFLFFLEKKRRENVIDFTKGDIGKRERDTLLDPIVIIPRR